MALSDSAVPELLDAFRAGDGVDLVRESVRLVLQELIEAEAAQVIGAARYERTPERVTERNGARPRELMTKAGTVELAIPKLLTGSFFPSELEARRRIDQALYAVVMEAWVNGVSTRNVDSLVVALGGTGISKSEVSRICQGLGEEVGRFRARRLDTTDYPYVFLDATSLHVRGGGLVTSKAVVVATGVTADVRREILGVDVGDSEDEVFWRKFLTHLKSRSLAGVRLVISDQHAGLVAAIGRSFQGAGHQRCRVHFARNLLARVPKNQMDMAAALFRTIFRPTRRRDRRRLLEPGPRPTRRPHPQDRALHGRRQGRSAGLRRLPPGALDQDLVHQPAGTAEQGDQTTRPRCRDLPQRSLRDPPRRHDPHRHQRRMDHRRTLLPLRRIHGAPEPHRR